MQVLMLGPLEVRQGDRVVEVVGGRLRCLLARLALDAGQAVSTASLIDAVWEDEPPGGAANALQTLVSRLRRSLGDSQLIQQTPSGYRLDIDPDAVDVYRFEAAAREGSAAVRAGNPAHGLPRLVDALSLWRGPALADVADRRFLDLTAHRLTELRLTAAQDRIEAEIALGRAEHILSDVEALAAEHPARERLARQLMTALYASGRQTDALAAYERLRAQLAEEFGADPSPETRELHLAVLRGELVISQPATAIRATNLRAQVSSFIGRDEELERIAELVMANRLVTLIGPGGAGKTRLAAEAARRWVEKVPDGVWFVELAPVSDTADLAQAVLDSLGLRESTVLELPGQARSRDATERLLDALADRRSVLVLDNCEHLISSVAKLADLLLSHNAGLRIVTTSREPLGIVGEALSVVPPLDQPAPDATASQALTFPAVQLLAERAAAVSPGFVVDGATVASVVEICRRLDGLPLAIELAAARLRSLPVDQIAARLDDRFRLLTGGSRTAMPRHRTLRAVVEWSWDLLTGPERRLAERLAVFPAGATPESAEATCAGDGLDAADVFDLLAALVDKSLLQVVDSAEPRYRMLETIREYGIERLGERGELDWIRRNHASYFAALAHEAEPQLRTREQLIWMRRLAAERDNLLAALRYLGDSGDAVSAIRLAGDLSWYWMLRGNHAEAASWLQFALNTPGEVDPDEMLMGQAVYVMNSVAWFGDNVDDRVPSLTDISERVLALDSAKDPMLAIIKPMLMMFSDQAARVGPLINEAIDNVDPWVHAVALMLRALMAENSGDVEGMRGDAAESLVAFRAIGDRWGLATTLSVLGGILTLDGQLEEAVEAFTEAFSLLRDIDATDDLVMLNVRLADLHMRRGNVALARDEIDRARESNAQGSAMQGVLIDAFSARIARLAGEFDDAARFLAHAQDRFDRLGTAHPGNGHLRALMLTTSAMLAFDVGDEEHLEEWVVEAYEVSLATKDMPIVGITGVVVAAIADHWGLVGEAAQMLGATARVSGSADDTNLDIMKLTATLREKLGDTAFEAAYEEGRAMTKEAAIARLDPKALQARLR
jgi:predicted ATPase/DNA-binding SARP family transcriptional activator